MDSDRTVTASFTWDADDQMRGIRHHWKQPMERVIRYLALWYALIAAAGLWMLWDVGEFDGAGPVWLSVILVASLGWFALRGWVTQRGLSGDMTAGREAQTTIGTSGVRSEIVGLSSSEWSWDAVRKVTATPDGVMFYLSKRHFLWVPEHGFATPADMEHAASLADRSGTPVRHTKR